MTVSSEQSRVQYATDGVATSFPVPFRFLQNQDLRATLAQGDGSERHLSLDVDYSVIGAGQQSGGTLTTTAAYPAGQTLLIDRIVSITQETAYQRNDPFPERAHEQALDKLTMVCQMLAGIFGLTPGSIRRALLLGETDREGQGAYRAHGNRIQSLGKPELTTDAARLSDILDAVSRLSTDKSGQFVVERLADISDPSNGSEMVAFLQSGTGSVKRSLLDKSREKLTVADKGGPGDGTDQTPQILNTLMEMGARKGLATAGHGAYSISQSLDLPESTSIVGEGPESTVFNRSFTGTLFRAAATDGVSVGGLSIEMDYQRNGDGHAISLSGSRNTVDSVRANGFGSAGVGGGTGVLMTGINTRTSHNRLSNSNFIGDPSATASFGWILEDCDTSFVSGVYAQDIVGYAHELKNASRHNMLTGLIANKSNTALAYGRTDPAGASYNVAVGLVGKACDTGIVVGAGTHNLFSGALVDQTDAPGREVDFTSALRFTGTSIGNVATGILATGAYSNTVRIAGYRNAVQVAAHDTSNIVASFSSGSRANLVEIVHPGLRTSVVGAIEDESGFPLSSSNANVVHSLLTGERIGSVSGRFHDKLGDSGAAFNGNHAWRKEHEQYAIESFATKGLQGDQVGIVHSIPGNALYNRMLWTKSSVSSGDTLTFGIGGENATMRVSQAAISPGVDNSKSAGEASRRYSTVYAGSSSINTSDAREKSTVRLLTAGEISAAIALSREPGVYQWLYSINEKGPGSARLHIGMTVQRAIEIMKAHGLNPFSYGFICYDSWNEKPAVVDDYGNQLSEAESGGDLYSFRKEELLEFMLAGTVHQVDAMSLRLDSLETRLSALE